MPEAGCKHRREGPGAPCSTCSAYCLFTEGKGGSWRTQASKFLRMGWSYHISPSVSLSSELAPWEGRWWNLFSPSNSEQRSSVRFLLVLKCPLFSSRIFVHLSIACPTGSHFGSVRSCGRSSLPKRPRRALEKMYKLCIIQNTAACISNPRSLIFYGLGAHFFNFNLFK